MRLAKVPHTEDEKRSKTIVAYAKGRARNCEKCEGTQRRNGTGPLATAKRSLSVPTCPISRLGRLSRRSAAE